MKTIKKYLEDKGLHYKFNELELQIIIDMIKEVKELTIKECVELLDEYGFDDQGTLYNEININLIK